MFGLSAASDWTAEMKVAIATAVAKRIRRRMKWDSYGCHLIRGFHRMPSLALRAYVRFPSLTLRVGVLSAKLATLAAGKLLLRREAELLRRNREFTDRQIAADP